MPPSLACAVMDGSKMGSRHNQTVSQANAREVSVGTFRLESPSRSMRSRAAWLMIVCLAAA
ncbi:protein of unknown function [Paraburkholderia kururiensis]